MEVRYLRISKVKSCRRNLDVGEAYIGLSETEYDSWEH